MKKLFATITGVALVIGLHAGAIRDKYNDLENQDKNPTLSDDVKKKILEENLTIGVKLSLLRYYKYCSYNEVSIAEGQYEKAEIHKFMYYVQYKEFTGYLIFENDPEIYRVFPIDERFYLEPGKDIIRLGDENCSDEVTRQNEAKTKR